MILEEQMDYYTMIKRQQTHVCAVCGGGLSVAWGGMWGINQHVLRCTRDISHENIREIKESPLSKAMRDTLKGRKTMDTTALQKMDEKTMLARVEEARWPSKLTVQEKQLIATISIGYGLDPLLDEITVYQGKPYPTINARYRKAQESMLFDGIDSRPATKSEREERGAGEGDYLYRCEVWKKGSAHPFVGWGRVKVSEYRGKDSHLPIVKDPDRMAEKRAESMALRKAFAMPVPFTTFEEATQQMADGEYYEVEDVGKVAKKTGEILEEQEPAPEITEDTSFEEQPADQEAEPEVKDETPISKAQIDRLKARMTEGKITIAQLGIFCNDKNFGNEWKVIDMKDLKVWQFFEVMKGINDGILHSGI
jgi:hypothetical protein